MSNKSDALTSLQLNWKPLLSDFSVQVNEIRAELSRQLHQLCVHFQAQALCFGIYAVTHINTTHEAQTWPELLFTSTYLI